MPKNLNIFRMRLICYSRQIVNNLFYDFFLHILHRFISLTAIYTI